MVLRAGGFDTALPEKSASKQRVPNIEVLRREIAGDVAKNARVKPLRRLMSGFEGSWFLKPLSTIQANPKIPGSF